MKIIGAFTIIHQGYLKVLNKYSRADILIISNRLRNELISLEKDIRKVSPEKIKKMLESIKRKVKIIDKKDLKKIKREKEKIIIIKDEITKNLIKKYLKNYPNLKTETGFLYHKREDVKTAKKKEGEKGKYTKKDLEFLKQAFSISKKSGCWWRQVGSVLVKNRKVIFKACNEMMPHEDECYKIGCIRDHIKPGEKSELCSTIHSEAKIIAKAAKKGISLKESSLYVTTFPCTVCAKLIAKSGFKKVFFHEGWSNFDGERILESAGVELIKIDVKKKK